MAIWTSAATAALFLLQYGRASAAFGASLLRRTAAAQSTSFSVVKSQIRPRSSELYRRDTTIRKMCGLVAAVDDVWSEDQQELTEKTDLLDPEILRQTTRILDHRGPDGHHTHHSKKDSPCQWGMGHTRLAIVDPSNRNADMPFALTFDNDRTIHLAANGEIYNHETLYNDMVENDGWTFERFSGSDCEVIAHAYAKYGGPKAVEKLDGMFAFVVFEEDDKTGEIRQAFAARDPVGIKPLYYGKSGSSYVFASELKALVGHVDAETVVAIPPGHYWTPDTGLVCYYNPEWLRNVSLLCARQTMSSRDGIFVEPLVCSQFLFSSFRRNTNLGKIHRTQSPMRRFVQHSPKLSRNA